MNRRIFIIALGALLAGIGSVAALTSTTPATDVDPFEGLRLGMSVEDAFARMELLDAAAFEGPVCSGKDGIAANVRHLGLDWQLAAHKKKGRIDEYVLERNSREGTSTAHSCRTTFEERIVPHYKARHPDQSWTVRNEKHHLHLLHTTSTQQASFVALYAGRMDRKDALCTYRIVYR